MYLKSVLTKKNIKLPITSDDLEIDNWDMVHNTGPKGKRPYKCICGKSIRYQYLISHKTKEISISLGSEHVK
jgi:hypothetical protein